MNFERISFDCMKAMLNARKRVANFCTFVVENEPVDNKGTKLGEFQKGFLMARIKYYYDTETCKYERIKVKKRDVIINALGFLSLVLICAAVIVVILNQYFETPKTMRQAQALEDYETRFELMQEQVINMEKMLGVLQEKDDNVYRVVFEAEPIPSTIRNAGIGGVNRYQKLIENDLEREDLIVRTHEKMDKLKKQMYIQTKSYDELMEIAKNKEKFHASLPAIQPVSNRQLKLLTSGFGFRSDPFTKHKTFHAGVDFAADKGTPIYSTGDGEVALRRTSATGHGNQIIIDHGFGFKTRYAHMSAFNVKKGQKVKRGECIGYVGSTGKSTGPHLHYEVIKNGKPVNPVHYFYQDLSPSEYDEILRLSSIENRAMESY